MRFLLGVLVGYSMRGKKKLDDPFNFDAWADDSFELGQQVVYLGIRSGRRPNGAYNLKAIKVARKRVAGCLSFGSAAQHDLARVAIMNIPGAPHRKLTFDAGLLSSSIELPLPRTPSRNGAIVISSTEIEIERHPKPSSAEIDRYQTVLKL